MASRPVGAQTDFLSLPYCLSPVLGLNFQSMSSFPSPQEAFPLSFVVTEACALPVIHVQRRGQGRWHSFIKSMKGLALGPWDVWGTATAMTHLGNSPRSSQFTSMHSLLIYFFRF